MSKIKFAIVGNGWRAKYYIRIAKFYPEKYEIVGVLCRDIKKAEAIQNEYGIFATLNETEIENKNPDFVVVSLSRPLAAERSAYWRKKGYTVFCETPAADSLEELLDIWNTRNEGGKLMIAEQYRYYPSYKKIIDQVKEGKLGEPVSTYVSLCHEYHGISLLRAFINEPFSAGFRVMSHKYELPVSKTGDRFNIYTDGEIIKGNKTAAIVEFADGKVGIYDFESEQYHSLIRHNSVKVNGTRGEIINEKMWYLDENNLPQTEILFSDLQQAQKGEFTGLCEDEQAIESMLLRVYEVSQNKSEEAFLWYEDNLRNALSDAYFTILLKQANGEWIEAEKMPWME